MKKHYQTVIFVAMDYERQNIFADYAFQPVTDQQSPFPCFHTQDGIFLIETGMSKTNAAAAAQWVFDHITADRYINVGLVGSLNPELEYGEVMLANEVRFHDVDVRPFDTKYQLGQIPGTKISTYPLKELSLEPSIKRVRVITGDLFVTDQSILNEIKQEYQPHCVDMEIAAIAHVAYLHNKLAALSSIKIVSDKADSNATDDFYSEERLFHDVRPVIKSILSST